MIRALQKSDIDSVAEIWLATNLSAHPFVPVQYWQENFAPVKLLLAQAEVYVYESGGKIQGFVGLNGNHIQGLFVCQRAQRQGMGKQLLGFVKGLKKPLTLQVYQKNKQAISFYQKEAFTLQSESVDPNTGEKEYCMVWPISR